MLTAVRLKGSTAMRPRCAKGWILIIGLVMAMPAAAGHAGAPPPATLHHIRRVIDYHLHTLAADPHDDRQLDHLMPYATPQQRTRYRKLRRRRDRTLQPALASRPAPGPVPAAEPHPYRSRKHASLDLAAECRTRPHPERAPVCRGFPLRPLPDPRSMPATPLVRGH